MKIRTDYITNSSSSSFILVFKNEKEWKNFLEEADFCGYKEFLDLSKELIKNNESKKEALNLLYRFYTWEFEQELIDLKLKVSDFKNYQEYLKKQKELKETDWFKKELSKKLSKTDYEEKRQMTESAYKIITGTIWDTNGGLLEWAIRNGYLEDNFKRNCIVCWNIG